MKIIIFFLDNFLFQSAHTWINADLLGSDTDEAGLYIHETGYRLRPKDVVLALCLPASYPFGFTCSSELD